MRAAVLLLLMASCTPSIERVERHDKTVTDSALSVLDGLTPDTVSVTIERVKVLEKVRTVIEYPVVESYPLFRVMEKTSYPIEEKRDTVYIYRVDTVYIAK